MNAENEKWDLIIEPSAKWFHLELNDLWRFRDLIMLLVKRDLAIVYKQTILGPIWYLLQPLLSTIVFSVIFGHVARISTDGIPHFLFYMSGLVCWSYFAECLVTTSNTFIANMNIFSKVYFPRLAIPISVVISMLVKFAIQCLMLGAIYLYYFSAGSSLKPNLDLIFLPLLVFQMAILGLGFGILISSLTTKYRDLGMLLAFGMQLWMYATPVVYPMSSVPEKYRHIIELNPMSSVVSSFRHMLFGASPLDPKVMLTSWASTILVAAVGLLAFSRVQKSFTDTV
jgi:lipopolysaccharide transport system permease protein